MIEVQFSVTAKVLQPLNDKQSEALQKIVNYIIEDNLPLDIIGMFVYSLNWSDETYQLGKAIAKAMMALQNKEMGNFVPLPAEIPEGEIPSWLNQ